jgi:hypothetical protein
MTAGLGVGGILRAAGKAVATLPSTRPYFSPNTSRWSILMESRSIINYVTETRSGLYGPPRWDPRSYLQSRDDHHIGTGLSQHTHRLSCEAAGLKGTGLSEMFWDLSSQLLQSTGIVSARATNMTALPRWPPTFVVPQSALNHYTSSKLLS